MTEEANRRRFEDHDAAQRAFRLQRGLLLCGIISPLPLTNTLYSKGVVSLEIMERISTIGIPDTEKKVILLNVVEQRLKTDPSAFHVFVSALEEEPSLRHLATQLHGSCRGQKRIPSRDRPADETDVIARYAIYLKNYYATSPISQDYKWPPTPTKMYINLAIIRQEGVDLAESDEFTLATLHGDIDQILKKKEPILMEDVLKPKRGQRLRFVLVEGAPGVGKSVFAWELCRKWDDFEAMEAFSLVLLLSLRDVQVQTATKLEEIFYHPLDIQKEIAQAVVAKQGEGTLLALDGADEVPSSVWNSRRSIIVQILSGSCLPKATLLVTTRSYGTTELKSRWMPDKHIEVLGFTKVSISKYIESVFTSEQEEAAFKRYISSSPAIQGMMYIPLNSAIVVSVYKENKAKNEPFPTTLTQLYTQFSCVLLERYMYSSQMVTARDLSPQKLDDFPTEVYKPFTDLAQKAFEGVIKQKFVFGYNCLPSKGLGFTTASPELYTGRKLTYNFLHRTLQEFLAAFHISKLPPPQQKEVFLQYYSLGHFKIVWRFLAGLTRFKSIGWDIVKTQKQEKLLCGRVSLDVDIPSRKYRASLTLLQCLYEAQDPRAYKDILDHLVLVHAEFCTPLDYYIIGHCITCGSAYCNWLLEFFCPRGVEVIEMLALGLNSTVERVGSIQRQHPQLRIIYICLAQSLLVSSQLQLLCSAIIPCCVNTLNLFYIEDHILVGGETALLLVALTDARNLQTLFLSRCELNFSAARALAQLIAPKTGSLKKLQIRYHPKCPSSSVVRPPRLNLIFSTLFACSSLEELHILGSFCPFNKCSSVTHVLLQKNSNLTLLSFRDCDIGSKGAIALAAALCRNVHLISLTIHTWKKCRSLESVGALALAGMLIANKTLQNLTLKDLRIGVNGATALVHALKYNNTLKRLVLIMFSYRDFNAPLDYRVQFR